MPRLDRLSEIARNSIMTLAAQVNETTPYTPLTKPLAQCMVTIVTSAGLHLRDDRPFGPGDPSYRVFPSTATQADLLQSHASIGFDRTKTQEDLNVVFPIDRLREIAQRGEIGGLGPNCYSFMGAQRDAGILSGTVPEVAKRLLEEQVDVVLLTPT
jgi:D-proline reductase (dithiol) PrdB